ncbi:hypothetical protein [Longimycelium tulufanense]|nr:hypothetical protein [Longimycelium tulufanense]
MLAILPARRGGPVAALGAVHPSHEVGEPVAGRQDVDPGATAAGGQSSPL